MRKLYILLLLFPLLFACSKIDSANEPGDGFVNLRVRIEQQPLQFSSVTKADHPLDPGIENRVSSLFFFRFDAEGFHRKNSGDYIERLNVESLDNLNLRFPSGQCSIVAVANITKEEVNDFYDECARENVNEDYGNINLERFKRWMVNIRYVEYATSDPIETAINSNKYEALPEEVPMSALYSGVISDNSNDITFFMGRLVTMLNYTVKFKFNLNRPVGYEFFNVGSRVHVFPGERSAPALGAPPVFRIKDYQANYPAETYVQRFFYVASTDAGTEDEAIRCDIYYDQACIERFGRPATPTSSAVPPSQSPVKPSARVYITCAPVTSSALENPYRLESNTQYKVLLNLYLNTSDSNPYSPNSPVSASRARTASYMAEDGVPVYYASTRDFADSEGCDVYLR